MIRFSAVLAACLLVSDPGWAQTAQGNCATADGAASAATARQPGANGTDANNAGSSGWTGGLGGSHLGTNPQGANASSRTWQPPTARGLDLKGKAQPVAARMSEGC